MINEKNFDEWMIRSIEDDLTANEQVELNVFLQEHPEFHAAAEAYYKTILIPDSSLVFSDKDSLKKPEHKAKPIWLEPWFSVSVAASVIALIFLGFWLNITLKSPRPDFTSNSKSTELNKGADSPSTSPNNSIAPIKSSNAEKNKIVIPTLTSHNYINHLPDTKNIGKDTINTIGIPKENVAETVTYFIADTLHYIKANQIDEIVYVDKMTNQISAMEIPQAINNYNSPPQRRKGIKMIGTLLKHSGNNGLANALEKYGDLLNEKYEISYSSALLSFHKTFNSNQ